MLIKNQEKRNFCLKRTSAIATIPALALILSFSIISDSWATIYKSVTNDKNQLVWYTCDNDGKNCRASGSTVETYDENGNMTSSRYCPPYYGYYGYNEDGSCKRYSAGTDYTYDKNGNKTSYRNCPSYYGYNEDGSCKRYSDGADYTYDKNGNMTSYRSCSSSAGYNEDGSCKQYSSGDDYTYDENGNETSHRFCNLSAGYNEDGSCKQYYDGYDYTYDENGHKTSQRYCNLYDNDGTCVYGTDYTYDEYGHETSRKYCSFYNSDGSCQQYTDGEESIYDENGKWLSTTKYYCDGNAAMCKLTDEGFTISSCYNGSLLKSGSCISADSGCGAGWRAVNGTCFRIGYTPPEAAEITTDADNTLLLRYK